MKKLSFILPLLVVLMVSFSVDAKHRRQKRLSYLLDKGQAGWVEIGMDTKKIHKTYEQNMVEEVSIVREGAIVDILRVYFDLVSNSGKKIPSIVADLYDEKDADKVSAIRVYDPKFKTSRGVGVGKTYKKLKKSHEVSMITPAEGNQVYALVEDLGISFAFPIPSGESSSSLTTDSMPANSKISHVLIWGK